MNEGLPWLPHVFAGWVSRQQLDGIGYLCEENRALREQLGGRRLRLTDAQRRRLAVKGKAVGRTASKEVACIVTPDTILAASTAARAQPPRDARSRACS